MKTGNSVQGFVISGNHEIIHLSLLISQIVCLQYFDSLTCRFQRTLNTSLFLIVHSLCFITQMIGHLLHKVELYELSKFFAIVRVPLYIWFIYDAHFFELGTILGISDECIQYDVNGNPYKNVVLLAEWYIIELRVFYGYILSSVFYLMLVEFFGINKVFFPHY